MWFRASTRFRTMPARINSCVSPCAVPDRAVPDAPARSRRAMSPSPAAPHAAELTLRGLLLGAVITVVFMTANLYMGLKTGVTFSTSIPAAMLAMGVLRLVGNANIFENNVVQTQASAAGTLCNVILVLPGLVLIGHWTDFPYWQTTGLCLVGGLLGIAYSIPLRRALVIGGGPALPRGHGGGGGAARGRGRAGRLAAGRLAPASRGRGLRGTRRPRYHRVPGARRRHACDGCSGPRPVPVRHRLLPRPGGRRLSRRPRCLPRPAHRCRHRLGRRRTDPHRAAGRLRGERPTPWCWRSGPGRSG